MAKKSIKIRAKSKKGVTTVKALMNHPMETGLRKNKKTGKLIPAHHISEVTATHGGNAVISADWSGGVSKNPYIAFNFAGGAKGDELVLTWKENTGASATETVKVK